MLGDRSDGSARRESFRYWAHAALQPLVNRLEAEFRAKLEMPVPLDLAPLFASDLTGRARAFQPLVNGGMEVEKAAVLAGQPQSVRQFWTRNRHRLWRFGDQARAVPPGVGFLTGFPGPIPRPWAAQINGRTRPRSRTFQTAGGLLRRLYLTALSFGAPEKYFRTTAP